jgi:hypothetical protein
MSERSETSFFARDRVAGIVLMLAAAAIMWESRVLPLGTLHRPGPAYMPIVTACVLALMGALVALRGGGPSVRALVWPEARHAAFLLGACAFAAYGLERLGYRLTTAIMVVFFLGLLERRHPLAVLATAAGLSLGSFYLFSNLLRVPLPLGPWNF